MGDSHSFWVSDDKFEAVHFYVVIDHKRRFDLYFYVVIEVVVTFGTPAICRVFREWILTSILFGQKVGGNYFKTLAILHQRADPGVQIQKQSVRKGAFALGRSFVWST